MKQNQVNVAKGLAKQVAAMGYTMDGKKMSHGHALEVVSKVAGLPNWDTLSAILKKNSVRVEMIADEDIVHLYMEGLDMGCVSEYSVCPDVIAIIDMAAVRDAARVLHANKGLLESVRIDAGYRIGDNVDSNEFTPYGAWVDIYSTNEDGSPNFGMFCIQQKYSDDVHSKGLYFNQPHYGDWMQAWIDDEAAYIAHRNDVRIEMCLFNGNGRFATDPENEVLVMKVGLLSQELIDKMRLSTADIQHYDLSVAGSTPTASRESLADDAFGGYVFGDGVAVVESDNWNANDEAYALEMNYGQEIGSQVCADTAPAELPDAPAKTTEEKYG